MKTALQPKLAALLLIALVALCGCAQSNSLQPVGGETNWLRVCASDGDCGLGSCECGACSSPCDGNDACAQLADATCAMAGGDAYAAQCGVSSPSAGGLCLPECRADGDCALGQACVDDACIIDAASMAQTSRPDASTPVGSRTNPTGDCIAPDDGSIYGYSSPDPGDTYILDCDAEFDRVYWHVLVQTNGDAYIIPRPDGAPVFAKLCADDSHPLSTALRRYTLCDESADPSAVNAMEVEDAIEISRLLHAGLVFVAGKNGVLPFAFPGDILDGCDSDPVFRAGPVSEVCDFEIAARDSGSRDEIGWTYTGPQGDALAAKLNELYGIEGTLLCARLSESAASQLEVALLGVDMSCGGDADCETVAHATTCHDRCGRATASAAVAEVNQARQQAEDVTCAAYAAAACDPPIVPPCLPTIASCVAGRCEG